MTNLISHDAAPSAPVVNVIPTYSHKTKRLIALMAQFNELVGKLDLQ